MSSRNMQQPTAPHSNINCKAMDCPHTSSNNTFPPAVHHSNSCEVLWPTLITATRSRRKRKPPSGLRDLSHLSNSITLPEPALEHHMASHSRLLAGVTLSLTKHTSFTTAAALALLVLCSACSLCAASPCDSQSWWDPLQNKCINCTLCEGDLIPLRPCQLHRDTICGSIYDLKIDWVVLAKTEPNWKERRKSDDFEALESHLSLEELKQFHEESLSLDWQTVALIMAVMACLIFFIVAACILIHHMRQWRRMERRLDQDVEELSTKLMAKLAEVQSLEGGTFFIGNADALRIPTTFQPQHVLLPAEKPAKQRPHHHHHHDRRILKTLQPGNVYIEESSSKG